MAHSKLTSFILIFVLLAPPAATMSCSSGGSPLERIKRDLDAYPEYSIILQDLDTSGNFFKSYTHRYKLVWGVPSETDPDEFTFQDRITDWEKVDRREYERYQGFLGMVIASKSKSSGLNDTPYPPGYKYVGNERYGRWERDGSGNMIWKFATGYLLMSHLFNMGRRPIYRNDWDSYRNTRAGGRPYFGRNREFGTGGAHTRNSNPSFFRRKVQREQAAKSRFRDKVRNRVRRSGMSGYRSRGSRGGK